MDISGGLEASPVYYLRQQSKHRKAFPKFVYITENLPSTGVEESLASSEFEGCVCFDCDFRCSCIRSDLSKHPRLPFAVCGEGCKCPETCSNRSLSSKPNNGIPNALEVFDCEDPRGFGVRPLSEIAPETFVCTYVGELIGENEARRREMLRKAGEMNYMICVQEFTEGNTVPFLKTIVDPAHYGGVGRFINHSCDPNLGLHLVRIGSIIPTICLFSRRHVHSKEELSFDYGGLRRVGTEPQSDCRSAASPSRSDADVARRFPCLCGSANCQGVLPYDSELF